MVVLLCLSGQLSWCETVEPKCCRGVTEVNSSDTLNKTDTAPNSKAPLKQTKPSKFDENIEDTIPVDIGENGTLIPDYNAKEKLGIIVLTKEVADPDDEPPPPGFESNAVLRKKLFNRGKKKSLENATENRLTNVTVPTVTTEDKDIDGEYGTRLEKRKSSSSQNATLTERPVRRVKRPKRSPIQFYDDGITSYRVPYDHHHLLQSYSGNKHRRYVRFPLGDLPPSGPGVGGFRPGRPLWGSDSIVPRSPRLVFRDPVEPGTLHAPFFTSGANLQDISAPEENRGKQQFPNLFLYDQNF